MSHPSLLEMDFVFYGVYHVPLPPFFFNQFLLCRKGLIHVQPVLIAKEHMVLYMAALKKSMLTENRDVL